MLPTALNGRLPDAMLVVVDTGPNGPQRLALAPAVVWAAMLAAGMPAGHLRSGYRTLAQQNSEHAANPTGALPAGESIHGEGFAADIDEPARSWARAHAAVYGLRFPVPTESWHAELDQAHVPTQEDDVSAKEVWDYQVDDPNDQLPKAPAFALLTGARQDAGAALNAVNALAGVVSQLAQAVWEVQIKRGAVGPAAAKDFLADTRILAETAATRPVGGGGGAAALSDADLARIAKAVADEQAKRLAQ